MKKIIFPILLIILLLIPSCGAEPTPEQVKLGKELVSAQKELADVIQIGVELKSQLDNEEITPAEFLGKLADNEEDIREAVAAVSKTAAALSEVNDSGSDWWATIKAVGAGVFGRTLLHAAQVALAGSTGGLGGFASGLLALMLGGSATGKKEE